MDSIETQERNPIWIRFGSEESDIDSMLDGSVNGWCRWCGTAMQNEYPKDGHALNYRCCSQACQLLYGDHLGYWEAHEHSLPDLAELSTHIRDYNRQIGCSLRSKTQTYPSWWLEQERVEKAAKEKREARAAKQAETQARKSAEEQKRILKQHAAALGLPWRPANFRSEKLFLAEIARRISRLEAENTPKAA
jgi:aldehyde:ferredoxin oxidoreductase